MPRNQYSSLPVRPAVTGAPWLHSGKAEQPVQAGHKPPRSFSHLAKKSLLLLLASLIVISGLLGWNFYQNASRLTGIKNPFSLLAALFPAPLKESNGRVNILLAGYSDDDPGHEGAQLTDSIMILSIDPHTKDAVVISVPRDLYVRIPDNGYSKINAAYEDGEREHFSEAGYPDGGMGLLEKTVSQDFGIQFDYQALLNYTAFRQAVDAIGGVTVNINSPDPRGVYDPYTNLRLPNGTFKLNGQQALNLSRARGDGPGSYGLPGGDFDRTAHQQEILIALKDKAASAGTLSNPFKVMHLANAVGNNVKTDMSIGEMITLYSKVKSIPNSSIKAVTLNNYLGRDYLRSYQSYNSGDSLIPAAGLNDYSDIRALINSLLGSAS